MHCSSSLTRTASIKPEDGIYVVARLLAKTSTVLLLWKNSITCTLQTKAQLLAVRSATFFSLLNSCAGLLVSGLLLGGGAACRCAALCSWNGSMQEDRPVHHPDPEICDSRTNRGTRPEQAAEWPAGASGYRPIAMGRLVPRKFCKKFQIFRHIKSYGTCMKY